MRLEQLNYLIAIDRYHSMNKAAENIFVSQQSISNAIGQLEEEFRTTLVLRTNRGSFLTEAGQALCRAAQTFYDQCDVVKERFGDKTHSDDKIELLVEYSQLTIWEELFIYYAAHHPQIELKRLTVDYIDLENALEAHPEGIAVSYLHEDFLQQFQAEYHCHIVETYCLSLMVSKRSALAQNKSVSLKSIRNMRILIFAPKDTPTALTMLLDKYDLEAKGNKYIYQVTHALSNELGKHSDVVSFAPKVLANQTYDSMVAVSLKEKLPLYLCAISKQKAIPPELIAALQIG